MSLDVYLKAAGCEHCGGGGGYLYTANITHNLNRMADEAGMYEALWRPEEIGKKRAGELVTILESGLALMRAYPERFKALNPTNGWGSYEALMEFVRDYLDACRANPDATIEVSR